MKKIILVFSILGLLTGCTSKNDSVDTVTETTTDNAEVNTNQNSEINSSGSVVLTPTNVHGSKLYVSIPEGWTIEDSEFESTSYGVFIYSDYFDDKYYDDSYTGELTPSESVSVAVESDLFNATYSFDDYTTLIENSLELPTTFEDKDINGLPTKFTAYGSEELGITTMIVLVQEDEHTYHRVFINYKGNDERTVYIANAILNSLEVK